MRAFSAQEARAARRPRRAAKARGGAHLPAGEPLRMILPVVLPHDLDRRCGVHLRASQFVVRYHHNENESNCKRCSYLIHNAFGLRGTPRHCIWLRNWALNLVQAQLARISNLTCEKRLPKFNKYPSRIRRYIAMESFAVRHLTIPRKRCACLPFLYLAKRHFKILRCK